MDQTIKLDYWVTDFKPDFPLYQPQITRIHQKLKKEEDAYTGWVNYPLQIDPDLIGDMVQTAKVIRKKYTAMAVLGIGGSYLGTRACLECLKPLFFGETTLEPGKDLRIYFAGHHLSADYYGALLKELEKEEVCICVISKSGTTMETSIAFELLKEFLVKRYGDEEAKKRIFCITDEKKGLLREEAEKQGYKAFSIPDPIGGRYSVLTPVGLFPIAVAGLDIRTIVQGAAQACRDYDQERLEENPCYQYGLLRYLLQEKGKIVEIFEVYEEQLYYVTEWLKQLFGESEGKEGKGILPMSLRLSTDLHSMGQFLQEGRQIFFETVLAVEKTTQDIPLSGSWKTEKVQTMHELNRVVEESVRKAHQVSQTPNIRITIPEISAFTFGYFIYFFEKACAVSCYLTGVNPFNQPGVEMYKKNVQNTVREER